MEPAGRDAAWLEGKQVAFSGRLAAMSRAEAARLVRACGGNVVTTVNRSTSYIIVGQNSEPLTKDGHPAPRIRRAKQLQRRGLTIQILTEEVFLQRCGLETPDHSVRQLYSEAHVCRILKIPTERLGRWLRAGLVQPVKSELGLAFFDFRQVSWAKTLCNLTEAGVRPDKIRRSLRQVESWLGPGDPLSQLTLLEKNGQLLVRLENGQLAEPHGQPHLDFDDECDQSSLQTKRTEGSASDWFLAANSLEEEGKYAEAIQAYQQALLIGGPDANTCFNLANVLYQVGQIEKAANRFQQAIEIDPAYAEAWNNFGNVQCQLGDMVQALHSFRQAVRLEPDCPSYHYNLADLLDELGQCEDAKIHWRSYLQGGETGRWADHARNRLSAASS